MPSLQSNSAADHTVLTPRSFLSFAATMFVIDLISVSYGAVDLAFIARFGVVMVSAVGLGDLVTLMYMAFFAGVVDVYAVRLARAEGQSLTVRKIPLLLCGFLLITMAWTVIGISVAFATPSILKLIGAEPSVATAASSYVAVRMAGLPFTLALSAVSVTLRIIERKSASIWMLLVGLALNTALNALLLYGPSCTWWENPVVAIAIATVLTQILIAAGGFAIVLKEFRRRQLVAAPPFEQSESLLSLTVSMLRTSLGVGVRQMNNYAAAVVPFMLISRLDVAVIAAATVATKIWTLYCRVPQAGLSTSSVFIAFARGRSKQAAQTAAVHAFRYITFPSLIAAVVAGASVPLLAHIFGGEQTDLTLVWIFTTAYLIAVPFYILENFSAEILTVEQQAAWLSVPSTAVAYCVTIPVAALGVLVWHSALIAVLSAGVSSLILATIFGKRVRHLGYRLSPTT